MKLLYFLCYYFFQNVKFCSRTTPAFLCASKGAFTPIRVRVLHEKADGSGRHVKSMDFIEIADVDADEGRGRGRGPV